MDENIYNNNVDDYKLEPLESLESNSNSNSNSAIDFPEIQSDYFTESEAPTENSVENLSETSVEAPIEVSPKDYDVKQHRLMELWENVIENHPQAAIEMLPDNTPIEEEAKQIIDDNPQNDEVSNEVIEDWVQGLGQNWQNSFETSPSGSDELDYAVAQMMMYASEHPEFDDQITSSIVDSFANNRNENSEYINLILDSIVGEAVPGEAVPNEEQLGEEQLDIVEEDPEDFDEWVKKAQQEYDDEQKELRDKAKANKIVSEDLVGRESSGYLNGRHWYELSNEEIGGYVNALRSDAEGFMGQASELGKTIRETEGDKGTIRAQMGRYSTRGNSLNSLANRLEYSNRAFNDLGIDPKTLDPHTRKLVMRQRTPGSLYNRKGTYEDYLENIRLITSSPDPEDTSIKIMAESTGIPEELVKEAPEFTAKAMNATEIDWDKLESEWYKIHEEMTNPSDTIRDEFGREIPDYVPNDSADVFTEKDEDFAGPDELPVPQDWKPEDADEDFVGPDEQLIPYQKPEMSTTEELYDTSNYNFDWDYTIEDVEEATKDEDVEEEVEEEAEEGNDDKEGSEKAKRKILGKLKEINMGAVHGFTKPETLNIKDKVNAGFGGKGMPLGSFGFVSGGGIKSPAIKPQKGKEITGTSASLSVAGGGAKPVARESDIHDVKMGGKASSGVGSAMLGKGGLMNGGSFGKKGGGSLAMPKGMSIKGSSKGSSSKGSPKGSNKGNYGPDINTLTLEELIKAKSKRWPEHKLDKDGFYIKVANDNVYVNRKTLRLYMRENPRDISKIRQIVMES